MHCFQFCASHRPGQLRAGFWKVDHFLNDRASRLFGGPRSLFHAFGFLREYLLDGAIHAIKPYPLRGVWRFWHGVGLWENTRNAIYGAIWRLWRRVIYGIFHCLKTRKAPGDGGLIYRPDSVPGTWQLRFLLGCLHVEP